jgi:hypothetical protein
MPGPPPYGQAEGPRLVALIGAEIRQQTGRQYRINLEALDVQSLRALLRLLQNLAHEKRSAATRARMVPWRR